MSYRTLASLCLLLATAGLLPGQALLAPPFGRQWGESPTGLLQWADGQSLDVVVEMPGKQRGLQVFTFQREGGGLPGHTAESLEARYFQGRLYEITIFYNYPGLKAETVREEFFKMKEVLTTRHGDFRLNGKSDQTNDDFLTLREAYHFEPSPGVFLMMVYTDVTDLLRKQTEARFSLIYHNGNVAPKATGVLPGKE
ncbi:MAG: hypothetical protein Q7Q71_07685 [Verrucomicrobiota bacterium JB023]|nr:hypothetical protein [Verrucomicrobiota bacterium JB023]